MAQQSAQQANPLFQQMGAGVQNPAALLMAQVAKLESWLRDTSMIIEQTNPAWGPLLVPIAKVGSVLTEELQNLQSQQGPSPQVSGSAPPNVPGNIPGGQPAA